MIKSALRLAARGTLQLIFLVSLMALSGCSDSQNAKERANTGQYAGWKYYERKNIRILYPPGHPQFSLFDQIADGYVTGIKGIAKVLQMPVPTDTLTVIFYPDLQTGMDMTGEEFQFVRGDTIHFWLPGFYGVTLAQWMLPKWQAGPVPLEFLRHGLITLFDHSGQDYHAATLRFIRENRFLPLATLAVDKGINSDRERYNSSEAASFCAFVLAWYGPEVMKGMYRYQGDFDSFVKGAFDISVDSLQTLWIEVIQANEPDSLSIENNN